MRIENNKLPGSGFSLIELMIVVAIISILAAIALPTYDSYTKKARFSEIFIATQPYKLAVTLALQNGSPMQELTNNKFGIPAAHVATKNIKTITVANGVITAEATDLIDGLTYILKPIANGSDWHVLGTCLKAGFCES